MPSTYPFVVMQDRYSGVYSGGGWLAIACATDLTEEGTTRADFCLMSDDGPPGSDVEASMFWVDPPSWIAVGDTPDEALEKLRKVLK